MEETKSITETTFEVTIRHYVDEGTPSPTERDIWNALDGTASLPLAHFDVESVEVTKL